MKSQNYAVIFSSTRTEADDGGYEEMSNRMVEAVKGQPGFIDVESVRDANGNGITVSYWESLEAIAKWRSHSEHLFAQKMGREKWYKFFKIRICKIEREYKFGD